MSDTCEMCKERPAEKQVSWANEVLTSRGLSTISERKKERQK